MRPGSDLRTAFGWHANPVRTLRAVDLSFWLPVTGVGAAALGALAGQRWARVGDRQGEERDSTPVRRLSVPLDVAQLQDVLGVLRSAAVVLDVGDTVLTATHAARSLGLDCGPMTGFDNAKVDEAFFAGTPIRSNILVNLGHGDPASIFARSPRLGFDEACRI